MKMKFRIASLVLVLALGSGVAHAKTPGTDLFLGYSLASLEAGQTFDASLLNGMTISMSKNFGKYFALTTDYGANFGNTTDVLLAFSPLRNFTSQQLFMGPQINIRTKKWNVFIRALGGIVQEDLGGFTLTGTECVDAGIDCSVIPDVIPMPDGSFDFPSITTAKFGMNYGIGLDIYLAKKFGFRVIQADYMPARSTDPNQTWRSNIKYSTGLVFRF